MKDKLAKNMDCLGKVNSPTVVDCVVKWGRDIGATLDTLWISAIVAWVYGRDSMSKTDTLLPPRTEMISFLHLIFYNDLKTLW